MSSSADDQEGEAAAKEGTKLVKIEEELKAAKEAESSLKAELEKVKTVSFPLPSSS